MEYNIMLISDLTRVLRQGIDNNSIFNMESSIPSSSEQLNYGWCTVINHLASQIKYGRNAYVNISHRIVFTEIIIDLLLEAERFLDIMKSKDDNYNI